MEYFNSEESATQNLWAPRQSRKDGTALLGGAETLGFETGQTREMTWDAQQAFLGDRSLIPVHGGGR